MHKTLTSLATVLLAMCATLVLHAQESAWLTTNGTQIENGLGEEVILKGMGLGGWMVQEGYMLQTQSFANPQHEIKAAIEALIGPEATEEFYDAWLHNHVRESDIDSLHTWGFNSVRIPMHYNLFTLPIEEEPVDSGKHLA